MFFYAILFLFICRSYYQQGVLFLVFFFKISYIQHCLPVVPYFGIILNAFDEVSFCTLQHDANLYGTHPFYIGVLPTGMCYGVFFLNSNAMGMFYCILKFHLSISRIYAD